MEKKTLIDDFKSIYKDGDSRRLKTIKYLESINHVELTDNEINHAFDIDMGKVD